MTGNRSRLGAGLLLLTSVLACNEVEEDRGPALTPAGSLAYMPNWSADGAEIYFVRPGNSGTGFLSALGAVSMSGETRVVDAGRSTIWAMTPAPDGTLVYAATTAVEGGRPDVFSTAAAEALPIALGGRGVVLAMSPDGARIAYVGRDDASVGPGQLRLFTIVDASVAPLSDSQALVNGPTADYDRALAFSPASDRLLYVTKVEDGSVGGQEFDLATGAATTRSWGGRFPYPLVHWGPEGLRIADASSGAYEIVNLDTGERTRLSGAPAPDMLRDTWAPDGSRIAFWRTECLEACDFSCCPGMTQYELFSVEVATGRATRIAAAGDQALPGTAETLGAIAWSPDSRRVAYAIEGRIHVRDVP